MAAEAGNRSKCYYVYALHPFMSDAFRFNSDEVYNEDLNIVKTKFEQLMDAGIRQFAILADDASMPYGGDARDVYKRQIKYSRYICMQSCYIWCKTFNRNKISR